MRLFVILAVLLCPCIAFADNFTINSGSLFSTLSTLGFNVSGTGFSAQGGDTPAFLAGLARPGQDYSAVSRLSLAGGNYTFHGVPQPSSTSSSTWTLNTSAQIPETFNGGDVRGTANVVGNVLLGDQTRHTITGSAPATLRFFGNLPASTNTFTLSRVDVAFEPASPITNTPNAPINGGAAPSTVPEPGTWLLLASGLIGVGLWNRNNSGR